MERLASLNDATGDASLRDSLRAGFHMILNEISFSTPELRLRYAPLRDAVTKIITALQDPWGSREQDAARAAAAAGAGPG